jgi:hypothetical protein
MSFVLGLFTCFHLAGGLGFWGGEGAGHFRVHGVHYDPVNRGVSHCVALPLTLNNILRQEKNYGYFKYFTMQKYILQKIL